MVSAYCFSYVVQPEQEPYFTVLVSDCQEVQLAAVETKKLGLSQLLRRKTATDFGPKTQEVSLRWKGPSSRCVSSLSLILSYELINYGVLRLRTDTVGL